MKKGWSARSLKNLAREAELFTKKIAGFSFEKTVRIALNIADRSLKGIFSRCDD